MQRQDDEFSSLTGILGTSKPRSYGTTPGHIFSQTIKTAHTLITHKLTSSDSLQSLSVKYEVPIADIKRINKLWNNESLSVRDSVCIPVYNDTVNYCNGTAASTSSCASTHVRLNDSNSSRHLTSSKNSELSGMDFLASFDSSIQAIKQRVQSQVEKSSGFLSDEEDMLYNSSDVKPKLRASVKGKGSLSSSKGSSSDDVRSTPEPVIRSKVKKKLNKHEETQDKLYEL